MPPVDRLRPSAAIACATAVAWAGCTLITPFDDYRQPPATPTEGGAGDGATEGGPPSLCPPGQKVCNGGCVPTNLPEYGCAAESCTRCSVPFADSVICVEGKCAVGTCQPGHGSCDGNLENGCEADLNTGRTCGNCTVACGGLTPFCTPAGQCVQQCPSPLSPCGDSCVDLQTSEVNCNACSKKCPSAPNAVPKCVAGACTLQCNLGYGDCNGSSPGCEELKPYYRDGDGDGFGAGTKVGEACTAPPGHSAVLGDCLDTDNRVKPGQTSYFNVGYTNLAGVLSYDFDCSGTEQVAPGTPTVDCAGSCNPYAWTTASRSPAPPGVNYYCGSNAYIITCVDSVCSTSTSTAVSCR